MGLIAGAKTDYYPTPDGNTLTCDAMPAAQDTGVGLDAFNVIRALKMNISSSPTLAAQTQAISDINTSAGYINTRYRNFGLRMTSAGDINGDGFEDLVVAAPYENVPDQNGSVVIGAGASYVFYGPLCPSDNEPAIQSYIQDPSRLNVQSRFNVAGVSIVGPCAGKQLAPQKFRIKDISPGTTGSGSNDAYGLGLVGRRGFYASTGKPKGDVNLDGYSDIIIGSPFWDDSINSATEVGRGVVLFGSPNGLYTDDYPSSVVESLTQNRVKPYVLTPPLRDSGARFFMGNLTAGDVNGDRSMDAMVPSFTTDGNGTLTGIDLGSFFLFY